MPGPRAQSCLPVLRSDPWARRPELLTWASVPHPAPPQDSRQHYEIEYRHRAANLEKCMSELWRMERKRDKNVREMKVRGLATGLVSGGL